MFLGLLIRFSSWAAPLSGYLSICAVGPFQASPRIGFTIYFHCFYENLDAFNIVNVRINVLCQSLLPETWNDSTHSVNLIWLECAGLCKNLLLLRFIITFVFHTPACGECRSRLRHICGDAAWPEETPRQSECLCGTRLLSFLFFCLLFVFHTSWLCALCPRILSVLQHPWAQAGLLLLQWCCCTRRCEEIHACNKHTLNSLTPIMHWNKHKNKEYKTFKNKHKLGGIVWELKVVGEIKGWN